MTTEPQSAVPTLTLGWRLKMALSHGGVSRAQMAEAVGYDEATLSRWMSDKMAPRKGVVTQWAMLTGVSQDWLESGITNSPDPGPGTSMSDTHQREGGDKLARLTAKKRDRAVTRRYLAA